VHFLVCFTIRRKQAEINVLCPWWKQVLLYAKQVTACNLQVYVSYPGSIGLDYAQIILAQVNDFEESGELPFASSQQ